MRNIGHLAEIRWQTGRVMTATKLLPAGTVTILCAGDAAPAVFTTPAEALAALTGGPAAVHTGDVLIRDDGTPTGPAVRRCEQLRALADEGRILVSARAAAGLGDAVPLHDLGVHRLPDLIAPERVFELGGTPGPLRSLDAVPNNLPVQLTGFVGRDTEVAEVRRLLAGTRLVTLSGPGGSGKTRLAAQVAAGGEWPDGVWWVELDAVTDVAERVAATLGVPVEPQVGAARSVATHLRDRRVLLCLDNCEHVLDGAAEVAVELLRSCPEVAVLTTSREPLDVPGETVWRVPPLAVEDAAALFVERAGAVRPLFTLDASSAAAVRSICTRLDGIPLAVELAAAWLGTLTPHQIDAGLDDRFALLTRGPRGVPARQRTLEGSIAWSHDQLDAQDRAVFRRLAVFAGGFTLAAAGGPAVLPALGRLVDKSLVLAEDGRYRLLETLREYAAARLAEAGETDAVRDRHLDHYLALAEAAEPDLDRDKDAWRARVEPERDNLRAALEWGLAQEDPARGRRLAAAVAWLWNLHGRGHEGLAYLRRAVARCPDDRTPVQARLLTGIGLVADTTAPFDVEAARQGLDLATELGEADLRARCLALTALGHLYTDLDTAWDLAVEAGQEADGFARDSALMLRGIIRTIRDRHDDAAPLLAEAAQGLLRRGDRGLASTVLSVQSASALAAADLPRARSLALQAVDVAAPLRDFHRANTTLCRLAQVHCAAGDVDAGFRVMEPFLRLLETAGDVFVPGMANVLGQLHWRRGECEEALRWFEREAVPGTYMAAQGLPERGALLRRLGRLDEAAEVLDTAVELARRWSLPSPLADALDEQGHLAEPAQAAELHYEALSLRLDHGLRLGVLASLDALTALFARSGREADAARVSVSASQARAELGVPRRPFEQAELATSEPPMALDDVVAFVRRTRGSRGRPSSGWGSLTPTELEVVKLAAEGCTNPEIGARLFMSRGTVKTHLAHVYAKLGIANRTELATLAAARLG